MLDKITKALALATLACYVAGVITTSVYLYGLDAPVPDIQALRARYVLTGLSVVLAASIAVGYVLAVWYALRGGSAQWRGVERRVSTVALGALGGFALTVWLWAMVLAADDPASARSKLGEALVVWALTLAAAAPTAVGLGIAFVEQWRRDWLLGALPLVGAATMLGAILVYATHGYARIPDQFGGGRPSPAQLLIAKDGVGEVRALGVPFVSTRAPLTRPLTLLFEADKFVLVRFAKAGSAVALDKSLIAATLRDSRGPRARGVQTVAVAGGAAGRPERGDELVLSFSEIVDPRSICSIWHGQPMPVVATMHRVSPTEAVVQLTAYRAGAVVAPGTIELRFARPQSFDDVTFAGSRLAQHGAQVVLTLGAPSSRLDLDVATQLSWRPARTIADLAGNRGSDDAVRRRAPAAF